MEREPLIPYIEKEFAFADSFFVLLDKYGIMIGES
jgi:hypothetical protein